MFLPNSKSPMLKSHLQSDRSLDNRYVFRKAMIKLGAPTAIISQPSSSEFGTTWLNSG